MLCGWMRGMIRGSQSVEERASGGDTSAAGGLRLVDVLLMTLPRKTQGPSVWFICPRTEHGNVLAKKVKVFWRQHCGKGVAKCLLPASSNNPLEARALESMRAISGAAAAAEKYAFAMSKLRTMILIPGEDEVDARHQLSLVQRMSTLKQARSLQLILLPRQNVEFDQQLVEKLQAKAKPVRVLVHYGLPEGLERCKLRGPEHRRWRLAA